MQKTLLRKLQNKLTKVGFQLNSCLKSVGNLSYNVFCKLFKTIVLPTVCYGSEVQGFHEYGIVC